jgi:uncharacterized protein YlxW (UPF0749 family)
MESPVEEAGARTALELMEECLRLQHDKQQLSEEVSRLRAEIQRLTARSSAQQSPAEMPEMDDSARRFALLELE